MEAPLLQLSILSYLAGTAAAGWNVLQNDRPARPVPVMVAIGLGFAAQAGAIFLRSAEVGTIAIGSFPERVSLFTCLVAGGYLLSQARYTLTVLSAIVGPIGFMGALAMWTAHGGGADLPPALKSPWLPVHVSLAFLGNAAFGLSCLVSLVYLWEERQLKAHSVGPLLRRLPPLETLDNVNFRFLTWGFVLLTLGILSGVLWAELSFGRFWSWEPRTIWTTIIWAIYAVLLHGRLTFGWGGRRAATLTIVGFGVLLVSFLGVNMLAPGQHAVSFG